MAAGDLDRALALSRSGDGKWIACADRTGGATTDRHVCTRRVQPQACQRHKDPSRHVPFGCEQTENYFIYEFGVDPSRVAQRALHDES